MGRLGRGGAQSGWFSVKLSREGRITAQDPLAAAVKRPPTQLPEQAQALFSPRSPKCWHTAVHTHPDASDARGAGWPVLTLQSLLALLATFTVGPGVTPVPLGWKGMRRGERERINVTKSIRGARPQSSIWMSTADLPLDSPDGSAQRVSLVETARST